MRRTRRRAPLLELPSTPGPRRSEPNVRSLLEGSYMHVPFRCAWPNRARGRRGTGDAACRVRLAIPLREVSIGSATIVEAAHEVPEMKLRNWFSTRACAGLALLVVAGSGSAYGQSSLRMRRAPRLAQAQPAQPTPPPPQPQPPPPAPAPTPDA